MGKFFLLVTVMIAPVMIEQAQTLDAVEYWWCSQCGLAYPTSQKCCLNKDCPLFKKPKQTR